MFPYYCIFCLCLSFLLGSPAVAANGANGANSPAQRVSPSPTLPNGVDPNSVLQVRVYDDLKLKTTVTGVVIDEEGNVLTSGHALRKGNRFTVAFAGGEVVAVSVRRDKDLDLTLLKAAGLAAPKAVFAENGLSEGRKVTSVWRQSDGKLRSANGFLLEAPLPAQRKTYKHNAAITADGYGSPLFDECGRVAGINSNPDRSVWRALQPARAKDPAGNLFAVSSPALIEFMRSGNVSYTARSEICRSTEQSAREEAEAARAREAEARAREERKAAEAANASAAAAVAAREAETRRRTVYIGGGIAAFVTLAVLVFALMRSRSSRRNVEDAEIRAQEAERARIKAETPPDPNSRPGWSFGFESGGSFYVSQEILKARERGVTLGRSSSCHYVINDSGVSREHCRIFLSGGRLMIEDLKSSNGTRIGSREIEAHSPEELLDGDAVSLGGVVIKVSNVAE